MFFKKKPALTISELVATLESAGLDEDVAEDEINSYEDYGIKKLSDAQRQELLMFHVFCYVRMICQVFEYEKIVRRIVDGLLDRVYNKLFDLPSEKEEMLVFKKELNSRCKEYNKCLEDGGQNIALSLGKVFATHLIGENSDPLTNTRLGIVAISILKFKKETLESFKKDYKIVKG